MADQVVAITAGSGTKIDVSELTVGANTVERQRMVITDDATAAALGKVTNAVPAATNYGLVVRHAGNLGVTEVVDVTHIVLQADTITAAASDTVINFNKIVGTTVSAITGTTGYPVTSGKTFRVLGLCATIHATSAVAQSGMVILRMQASAGAISTSSQVVLRLGPPTRTAAVANSAVTAMFDVPGGIEIPAGTSIGFSGLAETTAARISFTLAGIEY